MKLIRSLRANLIVILFAWLFVGCVADPEASEDDPLTGDFSHGVLILNEGLWRQDNSTVTYHNPTTGKTENDYFGRRNPGLRIGDTGNDLVIWKERAFFVVSTSRTIEVMELPSGKSAGRIRFPESAELRMMAIANDSLAWVTTYDDRVLEFNPTTLQPTNRSFPVGPAPEGIAWVDGRLFVANSSQGRLRATEPNAWSVSVLNPATGIEESALQFGPNPWALHYLPATGRVYLLTRPLYPDSVGGLVEINPTTLVEERRWMVINPGPMEVAFDDARGVAYLLAGGGVARLRLREKGDSVAMILPRSVFRGSPFDLGVSPSGKLYVADVQQFTVSAEIVVADTAGAIVTRFAGGVNPGAFGFY
jgi:DNA-binding beta-propeller fold protein YncE